MPSELTYLLLVYVIVREIFFQYSINKLVNKLMCRNYHEYSVAEKVHQKKEVQKREVFVAPEDLGVLNDPLL